MISRLIGLAIILGVLYIAAIFLTPEIADTYGNKEWNEQIRMWKRVSELDRYGSDGSLIDRATDIAKPYIDDSQKLVKEVRDTIDTTKNVIETKTDQAKKAIDATEKAYESVEEAKRKLQELTTLSGSHN